jgi:hypothetical protein
MIRNQQIGLGGASVEAKKVHSFIILRVVSL